MVDKNEAIAELQRSVSFKRVDWLSNKKFEKTDIIENEGIECVRKRLSGELAKNTVYDLLKMEQDAGNKVRCAPYIYEILNYGVDKTIITEKLDGATLQDVCEGNPLDLNSTAQIFIEILEAVDELHNNSLAPIIHRDLKPSNIFLTRSGEVKLIDFGIARVENQLSVASADTTLFGTKLYAPPEQFGYAQTTTKSDIFALGGVLYFMLTGENPSTNELVINGESSAIPKELASCINKARAFDPENRFKSCKEFATYFRRSTKRSLSIANMQDSNIAVLSKMKLGVAHVYNAFLLLFLVFMYIGCIANAVDPSSSMYKEGAVLGFVVLIFGLIIPLTMIIFILYCKTPFLAKHPNVVVPKLKIQISALCIEFVLFMVLFYAVRILGI